ncbi:hydroxyacylglutathione hydrolase [Pannonibacter tanglangensis]|uniref:Hydroxyacylglutathione hydrolase n=1 Tax=Pannonibacter tanglangensis TaxID=2750084 RepID=A0ABW9ZP05_9HYPH|nr:hydroxyacylglutathione hydrolase [Pannonibacter sp. XCT-34]NBN65818.1 hydroxyacylglutathione hydrolase [Pannonibacter sp. XCT-34]
MTRLVRRQFICLTDNYGVLLKDEASHTVIAIDVPDAAPYLQELRETGWLLTHVLITHHHWDHVQGLGALKEATGARVIGPALSRDKIPDLDDVVEDGDQLDLGGVRVTALATPGHTLDQISWHFPDAGVAHTGDTLFSLGCGRVFEGDMAMMWASLAKLLQALPDHTILHCGHEYTQSNARFALSVDPRNEALRRRAQEVDRLREEHLPTLPTTMAQEKATNPFLRAATADMAAVLGMTGATPAEVFARLRAAKDRF